MGLLKLLISGGPELDERVRFRGEPEDRNPSVLRGELEERTFFACSALLSEGLGRPANQSQGQQRK